MKRIGLMGYGTVASYGHMPSIAETEGFTVTAVFDPSAERLAALRADWPAVRGYDDLQEFLHSDIDAVTITSPAPFHLQNIRMPRAPASISCVKNRWA